ncbi:MAG: hypothetical protein WA695_08590 [Candidatus Dormiibacterota bacterium]
MHGPVSRWLIDEGIEKELGELIAKTPSDRPAGGNMVRVLRSHADPREYWVASIFCGRETYRINCELREMATRYRQLRDFMAADPKWYRSEVVVSFCVPTAGVQGRAGAVPVTMPGASGAEI